MCWDGSETLSKSASFGGVWPQADHPAMQPVCVIERQAGIAPKRSLTIGTLPPTRIAETSTFFTSA